ncbi:hypothetical protein CSIM01_13856 [Colletotrichum simmondsii]|uniref:Uncharacterized protein n=1 Tax=Colletotrichum simmondsii TaxID=703756 RepID=A0A135S6R7_9PEZI|nr:hypothetical protein CSIM01_13856 [Colletotrichum simmondsii]
MPSSSARNADEHIADSELEGDKLFTMKSMGTTKGECVTASLCGKLLLHPSPSGYRADMEQPSISQTKTSSFMRPASWARAASLSLRTRWCEPDASVMVTAADVAKSVSRACCDAARRENVRLTITTSSNPGAADESVGREASPAHPLHLLECDGRVCETQSADPHSQAGNRT